MSEVPGISRFEQMLSNAASAAPTIALEMEAKGQRWTPEVIATVIACVLAKTRSDLKKIEEWTSLLLPYVERHLGEQPEEAETRYDGDTNT